MTPLSRFRVDLHVHTRRYSPCAEFMEPSELGPSMLRAGMHGLVLTEHDAQWQDEELALLRAECAPLRIYSGIELSACDGHVVAVGVSAAPAIDRARSVHDTVTLVSELGGIAILVHPSADATAGRMSRPPGLGAVEIASTVTQGRKLAAARSLAERWRVPAVAGSDAHALDRVGHNWTELPREATSESDLAELLKRGIGRPAGQGMSA